MVGKKNDEISVANGSNEEVSQQSNSEINSQIHTPASQEIPSQTVSVQENLSTDRVSESEMNYSTGDSSLSVDDSSSTAFDDTQAIPTDSVSEPENSSQPEHAIAEAIVQTTLQTNNHNSVSHQDVASKSSHSDHLAQIRERLKQPFGNLNQKPSSVQPGVSQTENQVSTPKNLSETLNNISNQFNDSRLVDNSIPVEQGHTNLESNLVDSLVSNHNGYAGSDSSDNQALKCQSLDNHEPPPWALEEIPASQESMNLEAQNVSVMDEPIRTD